MPIRNSGSFPVLRASRSRRTPITRLETKKAPKPIQRKCSTSSLRSGAACGKLPGDGWIGRRARGLSRRRRGPVYCDAAVAAADSGLDAMNPGSAGNGAPPPARRARRGDLAIQHRAEVSADLVVEAIVRQHPLAPRRRARPPVRHWTPRLMRVALLHPRAALIGGVERQIHDLGVRLADAGHEVHWICATRDARVDARIRCHPRASSRRACCAPLRVGLFDRLARRALARLGPFDVVHGFGKTSQQDVYRDGSGCLADFQAYALESRGPAWLARAAPPQPARERRRPHRARALPPGGLPLRASDLGARARSDPAPLRPRARARARAASRRRYGTFQAAAGAGGARGRCARSSGCPPRPRCSSSSAATSGARGCRRCSPRCAGYPARTRSCSGATDRRARGAQRELARRARRRGSRALRGRTPRSRALARGGRLPGVSEPLRRLRQRRARGDGVGLAGGGESPRRQCRGGDPRQDRRGRRRARGRRGARGRDPAVSRPGAAQRGGSARAAGGGEVRLAARSSRACSRSTARSSRRSGARPRSPDPDPPARAEARRQLVLGAGAGAAGSARGFGGAASASGRKTVKSVPRPGSTFTERSPPQRCSRR